MGASSWRYFTPFKENPQEALDILRQEEFKDGRYYKQGANLPDNFEDWATNLNLEKEQWSLFKDGFDELKSRSKISPNSIEELFELNEDSGTHSIIDIFEISLTTDLKESGLLDSDTLINLFGTERPTHQMVEEKANELYNFRGRFLCTLIVVYKNEIPDELYFTGYSGD